MTNGGVATLPAFSQPNGYQQITSLVAAAGLTVPAETKFALIQPEGQNVRFRDDGTDPTGSVGMKLVANDVLIYSGKLSSIKFIEEAASAKLNVSYYK